MLRHIYIFIFLVPILYGRRIEERSSESLSNNFAGTKERPELNPVLSALINEDVMRSIESKRAAEIGLQPKDKDNVNPANGLVLTTVQPKISFNDDDQLITNDGLIDQATVLDSAGSEQNQKSRLQVKKGPNGVDYEYEYVYYYYDDDGKTSNKTKPSTTEDKSSSSSSSSKKNSENAIGPAKTQYTNIERSTTSAPENEVISKDGKDVEEGRLPLITRFPPRANDISSEVTYDAAESDNNAGSSSTNSGKKIIRPNLDLVDSDSFNTNEKQVKNNRNLENEATKLSSEDGSNTKQSKTSKDESSGKTKIENQEKSSDNDVDSVGNVKTTDISDLDADSTTPEAEKNILDLLTMLSNDNTNSDLTTELNAEGTSDIAGLTVVDDITTISIGSVESTTTKATTPEPTTTTTTTEPPTTTTTKALPLASTSRRGLTSGGRNRFRLNSSNVSVTSTEAPVSQETERSTKPKNRFQRPSFGGRTPRPSTTTEANEIAAKEETKPTSSSGLRGRTRNRFNLRGTATTEKYTSENSIDGQSTSNTAKSVRARPTFSGRRRSRPSSGTSATHTPENGNDSANDEKVEEKPTQAAALPTRASRFNLNRPVVGGNRLLPRSRPNALRPTLSIAAEKDNEKTEKKPEETSADGVDETTVSSSDSSNPENSEQQNESTTQASGLNRIRNRPRIQINPRAEKPKPQGNLVNRKISPLIPRRKIGLQSTTTEAAQPETEEENEEEDDEKKEDKNEEQKEEEPEAPEVTSEQPRGLGLLGSRRRLQLRKPGTLL